MTSATDVREWLRDHAGEHGQDVPGKGRIPAELQAIYDAANPAPEPAGDGEADYDGGVSDADFTAAADVPDAVEAEVAPRRVRTTRKTQAKSFRQRVWGGGGGKAKRPAKKHPRVSLKGFAEDLFLDLAWTFQGLPPVEKVLYLQAPLAGQVVEDTVRGTVLDTVMQPVARVDRQFKALEALTAPAWVAAIMIRGRRDEESGEYSPETKLMFGGLRHALLSMSRVVDTDFDAMKAKSAELKGKSGEIDAMIAWLFEVDGAPAPEPAMNGAAA